VSGCEKLAGAGAGNGAENRAGSGSHRNRFERRAEILPLPLRSHALVPVVVDTVAEGIQACPFWDVQ